VIDDPEAFRELLTRLHASGDWNDPEALAVIGELAERFAGLARKHRVSFDDCTSVVFEMMAQPSVRKGRDPKAVLVTAVTTTLRAWEFAEEKLCSLETARRGDLEQVRTCRLGDWEPSFMDYHPAFTVEVRFPGDDGPRPSPTLHEQAVRIAKLFARHGWEAHQALDAVEVILTRLSNCMSRASAYEALRRDESARTGVDLPKESWNRTLRLLLGRPGEDHSHTRLGHGILWRLALGDTIEDLERDLRVVGAIQKAVPGPLGGDTRGR
jgi:hypothetical protein